MAEIGRTGLKNQFVNNEVVTKADLDNLIDSGYNVNDDQICYTFSNSKIYRVGNLVIHNGKLCRAKVYVTPSAFNAGQWDCYDLVQNVTSNYSAYDSLLTYAINNTVTQDVRLWKAKSSVPAGQAPPTNSDVENTYWIEVSKSEGGYIGTYGSSLMIGGQLCIYQNTLYVVPGTKGQVQTFNGALSPETNGFIPAHGVPIKDGSGVITDWVVGFQPSGNISIDEDGIMFVPPFMVAKTRTEALALVTADALVVGQEYQVTACVDGTKTMRLLALNEDTFSIEAFNETDGVACTYVLSTNTATSIYGAAVTSKINRNLLPTIASYIFKTGALVSRDSYILAKPTIHALRSAGISSVTFQLVNTANTTTIGAAVSWDGANGTSAAAVSDLNSRITSASLPFDIQTTVVLTSTNGAVENILFLPDLP
jgi:hypothetical protein